MYIYIYIYMYIYIYIYVYIYMHLCLCVYIYICTQTTYMCMRGVSSGSRKGQVTVYVFFKVTFYGPRKTCPCGHDWHRQQLWPWLLRL
ncbi:MAG UNVERIFIED_CONTAM: hypothetical protein LVR18_46260 [Planctomycetaceae bacterium]